mgnify:CR=1 FL=1
MKPIIQVLIADDHPVFRTGLRQIIESDGQFRILHEASDGREAIAMIDHRAPDVVVLDVLAQDRQLFGRRRRGRAERVPREQFVARVWEWKQESGSTITRQMRRMGASTDWGLEYFTMDPKMSKAVTEVFVRLYEENLIYRDHYIVNWCPRCHTALADDEVEHDPTDVRTLLKMGDTYVKLGAKKESIDAARLLTRKAAWKQDTGSRYSMDAAIAKLFASECAARVADDAIQR